MGILGIEDSGNWGFWDSGNWGFWGLGILGIGDFGNWGFWEFGILEIGDSGTKSREVVDQPFPGTPENPENKFEVGGLDLFEHCEIF